MGAKGTGRRQRQAYLDEVGERDPDAAAELMELRRGNPRAYRKALKRLASKEGRQVSAGGSRTGAPTPGRATDPGLRVGPGGDTTAEDLRDVAQIRALEAQRAQKVAPEPEPAPEPAAEPAAEVPPEAPAKKKARKKG